MLHLSFEREPQTSLKLTLNMFSSFNEMEEN